MRIFGWVVGLAVALAAPVNALSIPSDGKLSFDVVRKGKDIGDHTYSFSGAGNSFTVTVATDIVVKVPLIRTTALSGSSVATGVAPPFTLTNHEGQSVSLSDFAGQHVLVWFFPRAFGNN